jgi:hygromycin-B 7''-O-kinase
MLLPPTDDAAALRALLREDAPWRPAMAVIAERHGIAGAQVRAATGSSVVFLAGDDLVIKMYAPMWRAQLDAEGDVLPRVRGRLGVATPELIASGELEGWPYLVMRRLGGAALGTVWPEVPAAEQVAIVEQLGAALAALAAVDTRGVRVLEPAWPALAAKRRAAAPAEAEAFLATLPDLAAEPTALVHADAHHEHVLLDRTDGRWAMTGLFDFADIRIAPREYDLVTPGAFIVRGRRELARGLLRGAGYRDDQLDEGLARRLFGFELLHLWADVARDAAMIGAAADRPLDELARAFWPL